MSSRKELEDSIKACEEYRLRRQEEEEKLQEQLSQAEKVRDVCLHEVEQNNNNQEAREQLESQDTQIAKLKKKLTAHRNQTHGQLKAMRAGLLEQQERALEKCRQDLGDHQEEYKKLKELSIPKAEEKLAQLQEESQETQKHIKKVQREIRLINKLELDSMF